MGYKQRIAIIFGGCLVLIIGWYFLYYLPVNNRISEVNNDIDELKEEIDFIENNIGGLDSLRNEVRLLENELQSERNKLISTNQIEYVSQVLKDKGEEFQLKIEDTEPDLNVLFGEEKSSGAIIKCPVKLFIVGQFFDFGKFLDSFDDFPFLIKSGKLSIETDEGIYPNLYITLTVYVFAYQS